MANLNTKIIGLTLGIRFSRSFRIPDISGDIIDHILYSKETPFGSDFFPKVQENSSREKVLYNPETSSYLRINTDDVILGLEVSANFDSKFKWLKEDILPYFMNKLFYEYKIQNIRRLGIIFSHKIEKNDKFANTITSLTGESIRDPNSISLSFSKKAPAQEALYRKDVTDYRNRIYNLQETKDALHASLDYQYYYEPPIEDLRECFVDKILDEAINFLDKDFYSWLKDYEKT